MCQETLSKTIQQLVVNDYFTPNIKAEVILDTLLTPYVAEIIKGQMGEQVGKLTFLTKEMSIEEKHDTDAPISIKEEEITDDRGAKIDYVLEDGHFVYLVELKTTKGSIDAAQASRYTENCCGKTFGEAIGNKLLRIIQKRYPSKRVWTEDPVGAFQTETADYNGILNKDKARCYLKTRKRASTDKYLYTLGQLLDHHPELDSLKELWDLPLRLVYLTPYGGNVFPNRHRKKKDARRQAEAEENWKKLGPKWAKLYLGPDGIRSSISLNASVVTLREIGEDCALLLAKIIEDIYGG